MRSIILLASLLAICIFVLCNSVQCDVPDIDVTLYDETSIVRVNVSKNQCDFRAYVPWRHREATFKIGRKSFTGTGQVGSSYNAIEAKAINLVVPEHRGFPAGTVTNYNESPSWNAKWKYELLRVRFPSPPTMEALGVFYISTIYQGKTIVLSTVKISATASIKPLRFSETSSIGESVTLRVKTELIDRRKLRWIHNNGPVMEEWNGQTNITIGNVRLADAGVYECFEEGKRHEGQHSIMLLIVRACPGPKYGVDCLQSCPTCWNGGKCDAETGKCVCPPGFKGRHCETACGSNRFGATCLLCCRCHKNGNCIGALMRPPDPIGLTCIAGFMGLDCKQGCPLGKYGANCAQDCHCSWDCDAALGCTNQSACDIGYGGDSCQAIDVCDDGVFGEQCEYTCHCDGNGSCNKTTGHCNSGKCAIGWAGTDCQQALPVLAEQPNIGDIGEFRLYLTWTDWNCTRDYGIGPADMYQVQCWKKSDHLNSIHMILSNLTVNQNSTIFLPKSNTTYECGVSVLKTIENNTIAGPIGPTITARTKSEALDVLETPSGLNVNLNVDLVLIVGTPLGGFILVVLIVGIIMCLLTRCRRVRHGNVEANTLPEADTTYMNLTRTGCNDYNQAGPRNDTEIRHQCDVLPTPPTTDVIYDNVPQRDILVSRFSPLGWEHTGLGVGYIKKM